MQAMQQEAMALGFDEATARLLVQQSTLGAAAMVKANPELSLATLREQVTSKAAPPRKRSSCLTITNSATSLPKRCKRR